MVDDTGSQTHCMRPFTCPQMEYCSRTLQQVLEAGPLEEADCWHVLRGVLRGLAYIHSQARP